MRKLTAAWLCCSSLSPSSLFAALFRCPQAVGISSGEPNNGADGHATTERWLCLPHNFSLVQIEIVSQGFWQV